MRLLPKVSLLSFCFLQFILSCSQRGFDKRELGTEIALRDKDTFCKKNGPGAVLTRRYYKNELPLGKCESEVQRAVCGENNILSKFDGSFTGKTCQEGCKFASFGQSIKKYKEASVKEMASCDFVETQCLDGGKFKETKGYQHNYCSVFPVFDLTLEDQDMAKLQKYREEALASKKKPQLSSEQKKYVDAILNFKGKKIPVEVRLKGDYKDHFSDAKTMSFRVKLDSEDSFLGMRKFSIQKPKVRSPLEAFRHGLLKENGVLALRYAYVSYRLDGEDLGVMAIEEHFSHELLEFQQARESVILSIDEDYVYQQGTVNPYSTPLKIFKKKRTRKNPVLDDLYKDSLANLRGLKERKIKAEDVFDMEKVAKFSAVTNLLSGAHSFIWNNLRFYYNPFTQKIEPVAYDAINWDKFDHPQYFNPESSDVYIQTYLKTLDHLEAQILSGNLKLEIDKIKTSLFKGAEGIEIDLLASKQNKMIERLADRIDEMKQVNRPSKKNQVYFYKTPELDKKQRKNKYFLITYYYEEGDKAYLEFVNRVYDPVTLLKVDLVKEGLQKNIFDDDIKIESGHYANKNFRLEVPKLEDRKDKYTIVAHDSVAPSKLKTFEALYYAPVAQEKRYKKNTLAEFLSSNSEFIKIDDKTLKLSGDLLFFEQSLFLPEGVDLVIEAGSTLSFGSGASLNLMGSSFKAKGTKEKPIVFKALDKEKGWAGIKMTANQKDVIFEQVKIEGMVFPKETGFGITGAVSIYEGHVQIDGLTIESTKAEDALNLIRSKFAISSFSVLGTTSDAIDVDWGVGTIADSTFKDVEGDAIDISGTKLIAKNILCERITDKALSIGEKSDFTGTDFKINNAFIGIASKDFSKARLSNSIMTDISGVAFAAYVKKAEYGPSSLSVSHISLKRVKEVSDACSECQVDISSIEKH